MSVRWSVLALVLLLGAPARPQEPSTSTSPAAAGIGGEGASSDQSLRTAKHPETYLEFAIAGGPVMIPIALLSVVWLAYLIERLITTRKGRILPSALAQAFKGAGKSGALARGQAEALCEAHPSSAASVLRAALERLGRPRQEIVEGVETAARRQIEFLRRHIRLFAIIASVAPLLGLLGTVTGMIRAFREVAIKGLGAGKDFAPGIYEALITTAAGLMVAIPALLTYYWLMARADGYLGRIDGLVVDFVDGHERGTRQ